MVMEALPPEEEEVLGALLEEDVEELLLVASPVNSYSTSNSFKRRAQSCTLAVSGSFSTNVKGMVPSILIACMIEQPLISLTRR